MAFYFFTDYDCLGEQKQHSSNSGSGFIDSPDGYTAAFGEVYYDKAIAQYPAIHVGDTHRSNSDTIEPYAYAVCNGTIAVVPVKNSNLVNIILKPSEQPELPMPSVKYYIYRGILRDSILKDPDNTPANQQNNPDFTAASDAIEYEIGVGGTGPDDRNNLLEFLKSTRSPEETGPLSPKLIMYDQLKSNATNPYLDSLFANKDGTGYITNNVIKGGWILGRFPSKKNNKANTRLDRYTVIPFSDTNYYYRMLNVFGFDIVLDTLDYNPRLSLAKRDIRAENSNGVAILNGSRNFNVLQIHPYPNNQPLNEGNKELLLAQRASMEEALNFMDPAAFWGSFFSMYTGKSDEANNYTLNIRKHSDPFESIADVSGVKAPVFTPAHGADIYENVLKGPSNTYANFANKNRLYFDIRNQYNDSYNLYNDNCYNATDITKNLLYAISDGQVVDSNGPRSLIARNYYNRLLPWLIFDVVLGGAEEYITCDTHPIPVYPREDKFGNDKLNVEYSVRFSFPTCKDPLKEQYSLFFLHDNQWKDGVNTSRMVLSADNLLDNNTSSKLKYLHYTDQESNTKEISIHVNTHDRSTGVRVLVAGYHRLTFIKHRTEIYSPQATDLALKLRTHLPANFRAVKVPLPAEFLDNVFNMRMTLAYDDVTGQLQNTVAEEYRYADISRATGCDMIGQAGVSKNASGDRIFYVNGTYSRQGKNRWQINSGDRVNICLKITSGILKSNESFLNALRRENNSLGLVVNSDTNTESIRLNVPGAFEENNPEQLSFFSFVRIPSADWLVIESAYNALDLVPSITNNIRFHKIYLCFKQLHNSCDLPNKYEYWLRGFIIRETGTTGNFTVTEVNQQVSGIFNYNRFNSFGMGNIPGNFLGTANEATTGPAIFNQNGTTFEFGSTVYLTRGMPLTYNDYYNLSLAAGRDLQKVYSSASNMGLVDILNDPGIGLTSITYHGEMLQSIPPKFIFFRNGEVMFLLTCRPTNPNTFQRSNADPQRRLATLFFTPPSGGNFTDRYTTAHEYGHVLGLTDRYAYVAFMQTTNPNLVDDGTGIPLYIAGDTVYSNNYRWAFNLMSLSRAVPSAPLTGLPFSNESQFTTAYAGFVPTGATDEYGYRDKFAVFLTPNQWNSMFNGGSEPAFFGQNYVFFLPAGANPSFLGNAAVNGSGSNISDANINVNTGSMATRPGLTPLGRVTYNDVNAIVASNSLRQEIERGGFHSASRIQSSGNADLTGSNEPYDVIETQIRTMAIGGGLADVNGLAIWNYRVPATPATGISISTRPPGRVTVKYNIHNNRIIIIRIISRGN